MTSWCSRRPSFRGTSLGRRPHGRASGRKGESENRRPELPVTSVFFQRKVFRGPWHPGTVPCSVAPKVDAPGGRGGCQEEVLGAALPVRGASSAEPVCEDEGQKLARAESMESAPPKRSRTRSHSSGGMSRAPSRLGVEPGEHHVAEHDGEKIAFANWRPEVELAQEPGVLHGLVGVDRTVGVEEGRAERPLLVAVAAARRRRAGKRLDRAVDAAWSALRKLPLSSDSRVLNSGSRPTGTIITSSVRFMSVPPCRWE